MISHFHRLNRSLSPASSRAGTPRKCGLRPCFAKLAGLKASGAGPLEQFDALKSKGQYYEAAAVARSMLREAQARFSSDDLGLLVPLNKRAETCIWFGHLREALSLLRRAVAIGAKHLSPGDPTLVDVKLDLAEVLFQGEAYGEAHQLSRSLESFLTEATNPHLFARLIILEANHAKIARDFERVRTILAKVRHLEGRESVSLEVRLAIFISWSESLIFSGNVHAGKSYLESRAASYEALPDIRFGAAIDFLRAWIAWQEKDFGKAEAALDRTERSLSTFFGPHHLELLSARLLRCQILGVQNRFEEMAGVARQNIQVAERIWGPENGIRGRSFDILANVAAIQGDRTLAAHYSGQSLSIRFQCIKRDFFWAREILRTMATHGFVGEVASQGEVANFFYYGLAKKGRSKMTVEEVQRECIRLLIREAPYASQFLRTWVMDLNDAEDFVVFHLFGADGLDADMESQLERELTEVAQQITQRIFPGLPPLAEVAADFFHTFPPHADPHFQQHGTPYRIETSIGWLYLAWYPARFFGAKGVPLPSEEVIRRTNEKWLPWMQKWQRMGDHPELKNHKLRVQLHPKPIGRSRQEGFWHGSIMALQLGVGQFLSPDEVEEAMLRFKREVVAESCPDDRTP